MADVRHLAMEDTDAIINAFYDNLYVEKGHEKPLLDDMTTEEKNAFARKEAEINKEPEAKELNHIVEKQTEIIAAAATATTANGEAVNGNGHTSIDGLNGDTVATT